MATTPDKLRARLTGAIGFPVTPFQPDLSVDLPGLRANLRTLLADPPAAIVAAGGTGELYSLTGAEHLEVVRAVVEECDRRVPVIAGVGFNAALGAELAARAAAVGADGILVFPPYYPNADEQGLLEYYKRIAAAVSVGILIYSRDWFHPGPAMVQQLAMIPNLVAWKEGQGDIRRLQILMNAIGDRLRWVGGAGDDMVPAYYAVGVRAFTSSVSNVAPRLSLKLHDHAVAGDVQALQPLMDLIVPMYGLRARRRGYEVSVMKALMDLLGLAGGPVRPPLTDVRPDEMPALRELADRLRRSAVMEG
ncbi:MAG TPA: dihydrodipicolinate synthase family protein [Vicinamibacterales bacterium]